MSVIQKVSAASAATAPPDRTAEQQMRDVMTRWGEPIYRHIRRMVVSHADAEDAVSQAVLLAWQSLDRLRDPEALRAWLVKISVNCARQLNRRSRREVYLEDLPPQAAAREDPRPELWDAVLSLPRDQRAAVVLYYYEDLPVADIASLLRVPAGTVKSRLSRARDKLRLALSDPQVTRKEERT